MKTALKKKRFVNSSLELYKLRAEAPQFIREEYRSGVGMVAIFTDREVVTEPHPDYVRSSKLVDAMIDRNRQEIERSRKSYKHRIDKDNLIQYVA